MLLMSGELDTLSNIDYTKKFFDSLQNVKQKKFHQIPEGDHFMPNWEHTYEDVQK